ncbi:tail protein X [Maridesulfovibrio ferrireducens]|uniref:tail protein X n=1 Tax=Maridesulfovibrio ferrireducens TaxID=246191 RepID=UPI0026E9958F|nr:tail protein X [Maridesulfovibrio ferrireducens]
MLSYTTIQGDTWDIIARKLWDRETMCSDLMNVNPDHAETIIFSSGIVLNVPEIETAVTVTTAPWRAKS